jgi:hypothetical protein
MHSEDLLVDDGSNRQAIETVCECFPEFDVVPAFAYIDKKMEISLELMVKELVAKGKINSHSS